MNYTKPQVINQIHHMGMMPVFYHHDLGVCRAVLKACYDAGVKVFEFTHRGDNAFEIFEELRTYVNHFLPGMALGIGSIIGKENTEKYIIAGADFVVSPILVPPMGDMCKFYNTLWIPGCMTLTEMVNAHQSGADLVKIFPGSVLGPEFVKAALAPLPWLALMPTGGVEPTPESISKWFKAGVKCVGLGGQLFKKEHLDTQNFEAIKADVRKCFEIVQHVKS